MIIDESHNIRCTKKKSESGETKAILDLAPRVNHIILLSGTPSLSRPAFAGEDKYEYAKIIVPSNWFQGCQGENLPGNRTLKHLSDKEIGLAKLSGFESGFQTIL
ncbi:hypothetical protein J5N97_015769 [Dioscorea zingiberensis]|uniref:Helicase ATP-binding domain-containing protein n=1 Tax=Dioscorea zingiberensis TaxID=325984 RepID=A0A9D5HEP5_9LILI|nr:hypothetical protein J5N97_015769 [Dioscorea zingiberensis]